MAAEYYAQCGCFCGCSELCGPSMVPLRGHVECQRCFDGECVQEHYDKERAEMNINEINRRAKAKLDPLSELVNTPFMRIFKL